MENKPEETQSIEDALVQIKAHPNWNRVFYKIDENHFIKALPENCNLGDYYEFEAKMDALDTTNPDGFITYLFHTHENGDHLVHKLDILLHKQGYERLVNAGVLY